MSEPLASWPALVNELEVERDELRAENERLKSALQDAESVTWAYLHAHGEHKPHPLGEMLARVRAVLDSTS
jgi:hypothetical protein